MLFSSCGDTTEDRRRQQPSQSFLDCMQLKTKVFLAEISLVNSCDQGITKLKRKCLFGRKSILLFKSDTTNYRDPKI